MSEQPSVRFAVIGMDHPHIYSQTRLMLDAGATLVSYYTSEPQLLEEFAKTFSQGKAARSAEEILEDPSIQIVVSVGVPCDRAPLGIEVMRHGKDYMSDKPGFTTLEQLAEVRARCRRKPGRSIRLTMASGWKTAPRRSAAGIGAGGCDRRCGQHGRAGAASAALPHACPWFFRARASSAAS